MSISKIKSSTYWSLHNQWIQKCCMHVCYPLVCPNSRAMLISKSSSLFTYTLFPCNFCGSDVYTLHFLNILTGYYKPGLSCTWKWTIQTAIPFLFVCVGGVNIFSVFFSFNNNNNNNNVHTSKSDINKQFCLLCSPRILVIILLVTYEGIY